MGNSDTSTQSTQSNNVGAKTLTDQLMDIISYLADAEKKFINTTVDGKVSKAINDTISKYETELGKTKDDLQNLVKSLDGLDFKEDGQIDVKVITGKVANLEASIKSINDKIDSIVSAANNGETVSSDEVTKLESDIKIITSDIKDIKDKIIADLTNRVTTLETNYTSLEKRVSDLEVDVEKIKAQIDKSFV